MNGPALLAASRSMEVIPQRYSGLPVANFALCYIRSTAAGTGAYAIGHGGVVLSPNGQFLAVTTDEGFCALVDPTSGTELANIRVIAPCDLRSKIRVRC